MINFKAKRGQVAVLLVMVLVIITILALLNVDTFLAVRGKNRVQNAGDAASLAAARKQASIINEIGRRNIDHIVYAILDDAESCAKVSLAQRRQALLDPVDALRLANEAAKANGMEERKEFSKILREHAITVRTVYDGGDGSGAEPYPEPFPNAWNEYATAIENVIAGGLATGPDNIEFYYAGSGHHLLNQEFYQAIDARDWCWFHFHDNEILKSYTSYRDWGDIDLSNNDTNRFCNSEIFSLHLKPVTSKLTSLFTYEEIKALVKKYDGRDISNEQLENSQLIRDQNQTWFFFNQNTTWKKWFEGYSLADDEDAWEFPIVGEVKQNYNVKGCAAICRCINTVESTALERESDLTWTAAAKPFGVVERFDGSEGKVTDLGCENEFGNGFVVPAMTDVRLVAVDSVGGKNLSTADIVWVEHIRKHLVEYLDYGPNALHGCFYCQQLKLWEMPSFRESGVIWLKYNSGKCVLPTHGRHMSGGGTSHGH